MFTLSDQTPTAIPEAISVELVACNAPTGITGSFWECVLDLDGPSVGTACCPLEELLAEVCLLHPGSHKEEQRVWDSLSL